MADKNVVARKLRKSQMGLFKSDAMDEFINEDNPIALIDRCIVPPFSMLDARQGYWQKRKREWIALGIRGEEGRGEESPVPSDGSVAKLDGLTWRSTGFMAEVMTDRGGGTSIFDPVLCEITYQWFCPPGGHILDPFAGESTKGIVATTLGFDYTGIELRLEQVLANEQQAEEIGVSPTWLCGDSADIDNMLPDAPIFDLIFTSPPYYDLEIYSESEKDGSAFETYESFIAWYYDIFFYACERLKENSFVVVKVGEICDKKTGEYRNFIGHNIEIFKDQIGLSYYNEMVLVTSVGSLSVRINKQFSSGRKIGKTHQNILVFYKGDVRDIPKHFPKEVVYADI